MYNDCKRRYRNGRMILHSDVIRTFYNFGSLALFPCKEILINVPFEQQDCTVVLFQSSLIPSSFSP